MARNVKMEAKTRFMKNGTFLKKGDGFSVPENLVREYETRDLAKRMEETAEVKVTGAVNYQDMTVPQLKAYAVDHEIDLGEAKRRNEIIKKIEGAE